jgi:hypothetical protein
VLANALATDDHEYRGAVSLSGPLGETLGFRLSASRSEYDGNVQATSTTTRRSTAATRPRSAASCCGGRWTN